MDFDATSLYPPAMYDKNSVYPKLETGFAFKPQMNDMYVKSFNDKISIQDGDESAILKKRNFIIRLIQFFNIFC